MKNIGLRTQFERKIIDMHSVSALAGMAVNDGIRKGQAGVYQIVPAGGSNSFFYFQVKKGTNTRGA